MHFDLQILEIFDTLVRLEEGRKEEVDELPYWVVTFHLMLHQAHFIACFTQFLDLNPCCLFDLGFLLELRYSTD